MTRDPTVMELRCAKAAYDGMAARIKAWPQRYGMTTEDPDIHAWENQSQRLRDDWIESARSMIRAMRPNVETMDGGMMNAMCSAFDWPVDAGLFPQRGGLTLAIARAIAVYIDRSSPEADAASL